MSTFKARSREGKGKKKKGKKGREATGRIHFYEISSSLLFGSILTLGIVTGERHCKKKLVLPLGFLALGPKET